MAPIHYRMPVDGIVEEIITALSRIRWLFVIARNLSFTYKGQAVDVKQIGRRYAGLGLKVRTVERHRRMGRPAGKTAGGKLTRPGRRSYRAPANAMWNAPGKRSRREQGRRRK